MSKRHSKKSKESQTQQDPWPQVGEPYSSGSALPAQRQPLLGPSHSQPLLQQGRSVPAGTPGLHPGLPHQAPAGSVLVPGRAPDIIASQPPSSRAPGPPPTTVTAATVPALHPQLHGRTLEMVQDHVAMGGHRPLLPNPGPHHIPPSPVLQHIPPSPGPHPLPSSPGPHPLPSAPGPGRHPLLSSPGPHPLPSSPAPHPLPSSPGPHPLPSSPGPHPLPSSPAPHPLPSIPSPHPLPSGPDPGPHPLLSGPGPDPHPLPSGPGPHPLLSSPGPLPSSPDPHPLPSGPHPLLSGPGPHPLLSGPGPHPVLSGSHPLPSGPGPHPLLSGPGPHPLLSGPGPYPLLFTPGSGPYSLLSTPGPGPHPLLSGPGGPHHLSTSPGPLHIPPSPSPGPGGPHHLPASPGPLHIPPSPSPGPGSGGLVCPNQPPNRPELLQQAQAIPRGNPDQDVMERYPPLLPGQNESLLPSHSLFRPELQQQIQKVPGYQAITSVKQIPQQGKKKKKGVVTKAEELSRISAKVEEIIEELSSKGKFLPGDVIRKVNMDLVNASNREHGLGIHWKDIEAYNHFSKLHGRIDELIKIYCMFTPITSLHELGLALAHAEKVSSFDELHMGPLVKHPRARDYFKPPDDVDTPPEITVHKLHGHLTKLIDKTKRNKKFDISDFLEFMRKKEEVETVEHLCVRIQSFPLLIQTNFKFRTSQTQIRRRLQELLEREAQTWLQQETEQMKRKLGELRYTEDPLSVLKSLAGKDPVQILLSVYETCSLYLNQIQRRKLTDFFQWAIQNQAVRHIFLLSIYKGAYSADKLMPSFFEEEQRSHAMAEVYPQQQQQMLYKSDGELFSEVLPRLKSLPFPISLSSLVNVELNIVDKFQVTHFGELGNGSFLQFVVGHDKLREVLGEGLMGAGAGAGPALAALKEKIMRIIGELCTPELRESETVVSTAVTTQLSVSTFQELSCGKVDKHIADYKNRIPTSASSGTKPHSHAISHLSPLLLNSKLGIRTQESPANKHGIGQALGLGLGLGAAVATPVGVLGHQTPSAALECLRAAPLLEDLAEWSHWDLVFRPQFGSLSDFILSSSARGEIFALEISPGKLIKISRGSSIQDFYKAVDSFDATNAAGHLVSLVVTRGNTRDISVQLLASHVLASLQRRLAECEGGEGCEENEGAVTGFVFACLTRIPVRICELIANEIFIDPLRQALSASAADDLIDLCTSASQRRFFQALGMCLGNKKWAADRKDMMEEGKKKEKEEVASDSLKEEEKKADSTSQKQPSQQQQQQQQQPNSTLPDLLPRQDLALTAHSSVDDQDTPSDQPPSPEPQLEITSEQLQERDDECRQLIETIRHENFGIGVELDSEQQLVAAKQREREGRGIKRLSLELYSKDTHFVLELIQNADDNTYRGGSKRSAPPSLKFVISEQDIEVLNNEVGFSESNVRAICDVGKSTKGAHRSGYIGQKGIGFKSVFRITHKPAIHSNGFHICFDASSDPIGFILPHWCEEEGGDREEEGVVKGWTTRIVLPLKPDLVASNMARKFNDVQPSLLLFLHRLRSITVEDKVSNSTRCMVRQDKNTGLVEISHAHNSLEATDRWFVVRKLLDKASHFKPDVEATELALAFPLPSALKEIVLSKDLSQQQVFAFLPLRSYGFRFIIQGDFDLPSSRECVTSDSSWNQWLREEIPILFLHALEQMKTFATEHAGMTDVEAVALFFQFVPLEGELLDFFHPLTTQILNLLRGTSCLPTEPLCTLAEEDTPTFHALLAPAAAPYLRDEGPQWKQPSQVLYVRDEFIREHISQRLLEKSLNLSYIHSSMLPYLNFSMKSQLQIQSMTLQHLKEVAQVAIELFDSRDGQQTAWDTVGLSGSDSEDEGGFGLEVTPRDLFVQWVANWLACVHVVLEEEVSGVLGPAVGLLKDLPLLPLEGGGFVAAAESGIFFPSDYRGSSSEDDPSRAYKEIHKEMRVLDSLLLQEGDDLVQSRVRKVLEWLGVKNLQPMDVIRHHILPQFKQGAKNKSKKLLVQYLQYVKDHAGQRGSGVNEMEVVSLLKDVVVLVTNKGSQLVSGSSVHFSPEYGNQPNIVEMFPDVKWLVVLPTYLGKSPTQGDRLAWTSFLEKLGVKRGIVVERVTEKIAKGSKKWKELSKTSVKRLPEMDCTLRDWQSSELKAIVDTVLNKNPDYQRTQMRKLAELLDRDWDKLHTHRLQALLYDASNESYLEISTPSSFSKFLSQESWLPSLPGSHSVESQKVLYCGSELFHAHSTHVQHMLHTHASYLLAELASAEFLKHLRVQTTISREDLLGYLVSWSKKADRDGCGFRTSVDHMCHVYDYLLSEPTSEICVTFTDESSSLVFVPSHYDERIQKHEDVQGQFLSVRDVCWMDPTTALYMKQKFNRPLPDTLPKVLSLHYQHKSQLKECFERVYVNNHPPVKTYLVLLKYISTRTVQPEAEQVQDFTSIALHLHQACEEGKITKGYLISNLKGLKVFPSHHHVWVTPGDCLLENDDPKLAKIFTKVDDVHFLLWPTRVTDSRHLRDGNRDTREACQAFARLCDIPKLSTRVRTTIDYHGMAMPIDNLKERLSLWLPSIQQFLFQNCKGQYDRLVQSNIAGKLFKLQVLSVLDLKCLYYIEHEDTRLMGQDHLPKPCTLELEDERAAIYVTEKKISKEPVYFREPLMKLFASDADESEQSDFKDFLDQLFSDLPQDEEDMQDLSEVLQLAPLSDEEEKWVISLPVKSPVVEESSSESEYSEEEPLDVTDAKETAADSQKQDDSEEPRRMTSWPPKAAIDPTPKPQGKQDPRNPQAAAEKSSERSGADVIGDADLQEMRKKHLLEGEGPEEVENRLHVGGRGDGGVQHQSSRDPGAIPHDHPQKGVSDSRNGPLPQQQPMAHTRLDESHDQFSHQSSRDHQDHDHTSHGSGTGTGTGTGGHGTGTGGHGVGIGAHGLPNAEQHPAADHTHIHQHPPHANTEKPLTNERSPSKHTHMWQAMQSAQHEVADEDLVDIQHLVNEIDSSADSDSLIPLIEISNEDTYQESILRIGRWGEEFVSAVLGQRRRLPNGRAIRSVNWVNESGETGLPYDIEVELESSEEGGVNGDTKVFIEVKSTSSSSKDVVNFSWSELKFAEEKCESYHLYRVYNAGRASHRLCQLEGLGRYLQSKPVRLFIIL